MAKCIEMALNASVIEKSVALLFLNDKLAYFYLKTFIILIKKGCGNPNLKLDCHSLFAIIN